MLEAIYCKFLYNLRHITVQAHSPQALAPLFRDVLMQHHLALRAFTARFLKEAEISPEDHILFFSASV